MELQIKPKDLLNQDKQTLQMEGYDHSRLLIEAGEDATKLIIQARKVMEFLGSFVRGAESEAIDALTKNKEALTAFGSKMTLGSTGDRLNYKEDPIYNEMYNALKAREDLIKIARRMEEPIFDSEGVAVPKVSLSSVSRHVIKVSL